MANPHDQFFCSVFQHRTEARGLLQTVLPPRLLGSMPMRSIRPSRPTLGDRRLSGRTTDLLIEVGVDPRALVLFLVEHQSTADAFMPARMYGYVSRVIDRWVEDARKRHPALPELRMIVFDLGKKSERAIERARASAFTRLALLTLQDAWHPDLVEQLAHRESLLRGAHRERGPEAIELLASYALSVGDVEPRRLGDVMARVGGAEAKEKVMTTAERLRREGKREGKRDGRREGKREGKREGLREGKQQVLLDLLAQKFGPPTDETEQRARSGSSEQLTQWCRRALTATSLDAVFEE